MFMRVSVISTGGGATPGQKTRISADATLVRLGTPQSPYRFSQSGHLSPHAAHRHLFPSNDPLKCRR